MFKNSIWKGKRKGIIPQHIYSSCSSHTSGVPASPLGVPAWSIRGSTPNHPPCPPPLPSAPCPPLQQVSVGHRLPSYSHPLFHRPGWRNQREVGNFRSLASCSCCLLSFWSFGIKTQVRPLFNIHSHNCWIDHLNLLNLAPNWCSLPIPLWTNWMITTESLYTKWVAPCYKRLNYYTLMT